MAPVEDDPGMWAAFAQWLKGAVSWSTFSAYAAPAAIGSFIGALERRRKDRRRKRGWLVPLLIDVLTAAICGCGVTPLFAHVSHIPEPIATSLAFFIGLSGRRGVDMLEEFIRSRRKGLDSGYNSYGYGSGDGGEDWDSRRHRNGGQ